MFKLLMVTLAAHLTAGLGFAPVPKLEFQPITSAAGKFSAVLPGKPGHETEDMITPVGTLQLHKSFVVISANHVYMIAYSDYPAAIFAANDPEDILETVRDSLLTEDRKLIEDKELVLGKDKVPGRELVIEIPKLYYRTRLFLADRRLYQVIIAGNRDVVRSPDADRYLDSFKITK